MKKQRVIALVLVFMMLMTSVAYGAIPDNSVIIGDKAYSIDYLMDEGNLAEINGAVAANGLNPIYFQLPGVADSFTNVMNGIVASQAELYALPAITYKDATGQITVYDPAFGPAEATITALAPAAVTTTAGTAPELPATVIATMSDSTTQDAAVTWDALDAASYASAGSFVVYGSVVGTTIQAVANVTVNPVSVDGVATLETSVFNAIPDVQGRYTGVQPTNVVLLGTQAKVVAKALDANGSPVSGAKLTFVITSAKTYSEDPEYQFNYFSTGLTEQDKGPVGDETFKATALFDNALATVTKTTGADGTAMVTLNNTVEFAEEGMYPPSPPPYIGDHSAFQAGPFNPSMAWFANQRGAATEVTYIVSYDGDAVTENGSVAFATLYNEQLETADNIDRYFDDELNSEAIMYGVKVESVYESLDYSSYDTQTLYPFSQVGGQTLAYLTKYATSNQVSFAGVFNNYLKVTGPQIGLYVYDSQFIPGPSGNSDNVSAELSHSVNGLLPNKTNIYTEPLLQIDGSVNYARLTFESLNLSPGSAVSVYFVPAAGAAPTGATTMPRPAYTNFAGTFIDNSNPVTGDATWVKTFFAVPADYIDVTDVSEFNDYEGAMPFADDNFTVQIPSSRQAGTIYVVLQTPGQIDPGMNTGYVLSRIEKNYGTQTQPFNSAFDNVKLDTHLIWNPVEIDYTYEREMSNTQKERLIGEQPDQNGNYKWAANPNWRYTYAAPAYPQVGNAIIRAYDGNNQVQMAWSAATRAKTVEQDGRIWNENEIQIWKENSVRPLAMDAIQRGLVGEIFNQGNGIAYIDSKVTGYTELQGILDFGKDSSGQDIVPLDYLNTLGCEFYAFAQWTPAPIPDPVDPPDPSRFYPVDQQYTLAGQRVAIEATVTDANGNLVQFKTIPVTFYVSASGDNTVTARFVDPTDSSTKDANIAPGNCESFTVNSNTNGLAKISISAAEKAAVIVQAEAVDPQTGVKYHVTLKDGPAGNQQNLNVGGLTQINFGQGSLSYIPEDNNFIPKDSQISMSKAIVGNQQNFGLISEVTWPGQGFNDVPNLADPDNNLPYVNQAQQIIVKDMPLTVSTSEPTKFQVQKADPTTSTDDNPADIYGNRTGIEHWYAFSDTTGYQYIYVTVSAGNWTSMYLTKSDGTTRVNNPGEGKAVGLNVLNVPVQWMARAAVAQMVTPFEVNVPANQQTPVTVRVTDSLGNPISGQTVTFALNYMTVGTAVLTPDTDSESYREEVITDTNGYATLYVIGGTEGEINQVAVTVFNKNTGTVIMFEDGTETGTQIINWVAPQVVDTITCTSPAADGSVSADILAAEGLTFTFNLKDANGAVVPDTDVTFALTTVPNPALGNYALSTTGPVKSDANGNVSVTVTCPNAQNLEKFKVTATATVSGITASGSREMTVIGPTVVSIQPSAAVQIPNGTLLVDLLAGTNAGDKLPTTVQANMSSGPSPLTTTVTWTPDGNYTQFVAGTYPFNGVVTPPVGSSGIVPGTMINVIILPPEATILSVVNPADISVPYGTTLDTAKALLPTTVLTNLSDATTVNGDVAWASDTVPPYAATTPGRYQLSGTVTVPGVVGSATATVYITVLEPLTALSTEPTADITVDNGTSLDDAKALLPGAVLVNLSDGTTVSATVTWSDITNPAYAAATPGRYELSGTVGAISGVVGAIPNASAGIIVGPEVTALSVLNPRDITVTNGTTLAEAIALLPDSVLVNLSDGTMVRSDVTWNCPAYDPAVAGRYEFIGTVAAISGVVGTIPDAVTHVTVLAAEEVTAVSTVPTPDITVANGTTLAEATALLPTSVLVNLSNGTTVNAAVTWDSATNPAYDAATPGRYELSGTVGAISGVTGAIPAASAGIIVGPQVTALSVVNPDEITVTNGTTLAAATALLPGTVLVNLSNGTTVSAAVTWDSPAYDPIVAGRYAVIGTIAAITGVTGPIPDALTYVTVLPAQPALIALSVVNPADITAPSGATILAQAKMLLPTTVLVNLSDGTTVSAAVTWGGTTTPAYDAATPGRYVLNGAVGAISGVTGPIPAASVGIIVEGIVVLVPLESIGDVIYDFGTGTWLFQAGAVLPAGATVSYQWQRMPLGGDPATDWTDIAGANSATYQSSSGEWGSNWIRVLATGTGLYTGTVTSNTF